MSFGGFISLWAIITLLAVVTVDLVVEGNMIAVVSGVCLGGLIGIVLYQRAR